MWPTRLTALEQDAEGLKAARQCRSRRPDDAGLWRSGSAQDGYASYLALLSAEQAYQQARINLVQAQASRYADTAALFQALGGGWWHRADLNGDKNAELDPSSLRALARRLCGCWRRPAVRPKATMTRSKPPSTPTNVTLTAEQRQHIQLLHGRAGRVSQGDRHHRRGRFRQRPGHQRAGADLRAGDAAAGFARRYGAQGPGPGRSGLRRLCHGGQRLSARRSPPRPMRAGSRTSTRTWCSIKASRSARPTRRRPTPPMPRPTATPPCRRLIALNIDPPPSSDIRAGKPLARVEGMIRSPIAGTVVERLITPGQLLQAGTTPASPSPIFPASG